jgi:tetratricopeptide (TPR) repeat protein
MEKIDLVLKQQHLDHAALFDRMEEVATEYREQILARELAAGLRAPTRQLLAGMLVYELPVPLPAVAALFPDRSESEIHAALAAAAAVGLVEEEPQPAEPVYRVPRLLEPILEPDHPADPGPLIEAAAAALFRLCWEGDYPASEAESLEIARLGRLARRVDIAAPVIYSIGRRWIYATRYREAFPLFTEAIDAVGRDYRLIGGLGEVSAFLGDGDEANRLLDEALSACPSGEERTRLALGHAYSNLLIQRGRTEDALKILREQQLPAAERLGDVHARAVTLGQIADVLARRGETDEALRICRDDVLPPLRRIDDPATMAQVLIRMALYSSHSGRREDAIQYLGEAVPFAVRAGDRGTLEFLKRILGGTDLSDQGEPA